MTLEIVWRNPLPIGKSRSSIRQVAYEQRVTVYLVANAGITKEFEVIFGGAA